MNSVTKFAPPRIVGLAGNVHRPSRSRALLEAIAGAVQEEVGSAPAIFDLLDAGSGLGMALSRDNLTGQAGSIVAQIEQADALIVSVPVYKGSYPGLFKHLFDFVDQKALAQKPVIVAATGRGLQHALVIEHQLRPLFGFFCAATLPTGIYALDEHFEGGVLRAPEVRMHVRQAARQLRDMLLGRPVPDAVVGGPGASKDGTA